MSDLARQDATSLLQALAVRRVSAVDLLKAALARHAETHKALNAVVAADPDRGLEAARAVDELRAKGATVGPLAGLPMTIKDTFDVNGMPASSGIAALKRRQAEDAVVVGHARHAGAVIWGKTNVPVMAGDWQSYNSVYGATNNPWNPGRTCGGSSGGAAAALAAGITPLEIGSDIGGSLRVPAGFCGVFSHKPTWGMVSQRGHVPPQPGSWSERDLNVVGPMARSARDLRLLLSVIEDGPLAPRAPSADLAKTRIGLWLDDPLCPLDPQVRAVVEQLARDLQAQGAIVEPIKSPVDMNALLGSYQMLLGSIIGEDMGEKQLKRIERGRWIARRALTRGAHPLSPAAMAVAATARHVEWMAADNVRARLRHDVEEAFGKWDAILAPITPTPPFPHDHRPFARRQLELSDGEVIPYTSNLTWIALATALHLPATAVPAGRTSAGLPVGAQLIGAHADDSRTLAIAQAIDENIRGFDPPPL